MNILLVYIRKHLMMNKSSTGLSILSLIAASALFFVVVCLSVNTIVGYNESIIHSFGNYHAVFYDADERFEEALQLHAHIKNVNEVEYLEKIETDWFLSKDKQAFYLIGLDEKVFGDLGLTLLEGRYPNQENEVLVSQKTLSDSKINLNLEEIIDLNAQQIHVVGIVEDCFFDINEDYYALLTIPRGIEKKALYIQYLDTKDIRQDSEQIASAFRNEYVSYEVNESFLFFHLTDGNVRSGILFLAAGIIFAIFLIINLVLIRNCFKNSYANREKHLAILKTVGVTQSQCRTMILYEGILILSISLTIGLLCGWLCYDVLIHFFNNQLHSISVHSFSFSTYYRIPILLLTIFYVTVSALFFIRRSTKKMIAQNVSATLHSDDEVVVIDQPYLQLEKKQSIFMRLFKKNIRQNQRSYRHLIIGVTAIVSLFILMNGYMGYLREGSFFDINDHNYDVEVILKHDTYPTQLMTQLKRRKNASSVVISETIQLTSRDFAALNDHYFEHTLLGQQIPFEVIAYSDEVLASFAASKSIRDYERLFNLEEPTGILINQMYSSSHRRFYDILDADHICDLSYQQQVIWPSLQVIHTDFLITGTGYQKKPQILVSHALLQNMIEKMEIREHEYHIYFQSSDSNALVRELNILNDGSVFDYEVINAQAALKDGKIILSLIRMLSYGYVLCLIVMGILATCCVTSINFEYRKKEFLLYRALGMRMKEMMGLIFAEIMYYSVQVFFWAWLTSQLLNYISYELYFKNLGIRFFVPENSMIGSVATLIIVLGGFMCYTYVRMKTQKYSSILKNEISLM